VGSFTLPSKSISQYKYTFCSYVHTEQGIGRGKGYRNMADKRSVNELFSNFQFFFDKNLSGF